MANTTRNEIAREVNNFYDRTLLERAVPLFIHQRWGQVRDIPRNAGTNTIKFRRYSNLAAALTPLQEGVTPQGSQISVTDITATVQQYGDYVTYTDVVEMETPDPFLMETAEILGDQAGDTLDILLRDVMAAGTSVTYVGQSDRISITGSNKIAGVEVKKAVRTLKNNKARRITSMISATPGIDTTPVSAAYVGLVHPNTTYDLKGDTLFTPVEKYSSQMGVMEGEVGKLDEVRFVESTNCKVFAGAGASSIDVYATIILGANAYGVTRISGESLHNIVKPVGSAGTADPLNQRGTSGWKATFVGKILNNDFMTRLEHAVSD